MSVHVEEAYPNGIPQTAVAGWSPRAVAWHWSAGAAGRAGWESTIRHLVATRTTANASYHGGIWAEHDAGHRACRTVIQWIVPITKAAHSIAPSQVFVLNPNKPRALQEARFAEVRRILARDNDPNADCLALAYAGMPADLERDLGCAVFRADVREIARQLIAHPTVIDRPHFGHGWIQPISRYEMDVATDFIALLYLEDDMTLTDWLPVEEDWTTGVGPGVSTSTAGAANGEFWTGGPGQGEQKHFNEPYAFHSFAESRDGNWRMGVAAGIAEVLCVHRLNLRNPRNRRPAAPAYGYQPAAVGIDPKVAAERAYDAADATARAARRHADGYRPS